MRPKQWRSNTEGDNQADGFKTILKESLDLQCGSAKGGKNSQALQGGQVWEQSTPYETWWLRMQSRSTWQWEAMAGIWTLVACRKQRLCLVLGLFAFRVIPHSSPIVFCIRKGLAPLSCVSRLSWHLASCLLTWWKAPARDQRIGGRKSLLLLARETQWVLGISDWLKST